MVHVIVSVTDLVISVLVFIFFRTSLVLDVFQFSGTILVFIMLLNELSQYSAFGAMSQQSAILPLHRMDWQFSYASLFKLICKFFLSYFIFQYWLYFICFYCKCSIHMFFFSIGVAVLPILHSNTYLLLNYYHIFLPPFHVPLDWYAIHLYLNVCHNKRFR